LFLFRRKHKKDKKHKRHGDKEKNVDNKHEKRDRVELEESRLEFGEKQDKHNGSNHTDVMLEVQPSPTVSSPSYSRTGKESAFPGAEDDGSVASVDILEEDMNLEELMRQKELLQKVLASIPADEPPVVDETHKEKKLKNDTAEKVPRSKEHTSKRTRHGSREKERKDDSPTKFKEIKKEDAHVSKLSKDSKHEKIILASSVESITLEPARKKTRVERVEPDNRERDRREYNRDDRDRHGGRRNDKDSNQNESVRKDRDIGRSRHNEPSRTGRDHRGDDRDFRRDANKSNNENIRTHRDYSPKRDLVNVSRDRDSRFGGVGGDKRENRVQGRHDREDRVDRRGSDRMGRDRDVRRNRDDSPLGRGQRRSGGDRDRHNREADRKHGHGKKKEHESDEE